MTAPDNLVEAVAQAFADEVAKIECFPSTPPAEMPERAMLCRSIRVAILATLEGIMEPTPEMIYAGEQAINANIMGEPNDSVEDESVAAWQAMLTTLLASMKDESHG